MKERKEYWMGKEKGGKSVSKKGEKEIYVLKLLRKEEQE